MSLPSALVMTAQKRNAVKRGPTSSDAYNDSMDEILRDLANIVNQWNTYLVNLFSTLPDNDPSGEPDAFTNGLDGKTILVDSLADSGIALVRYWNANSSPTRPNTIKEQFEAVYSDITTQIEVLRNEVEAFVQGELDNPHLAGKVTGDGTDDYTVTIGVTLPNTNYAVTVTPSVDRTVWVPEVDKTTTTFRVRTSATISASQYLNWHVFRY